MKKFLTIILLIILLIIFFIFPKIDNALNFPKYQKKIWSHSFNFFMNLPDVMKSTIMIFSNKKNFSNLMNDYNVKFLPETQYFDLDFKVKKINFGNNTRHTFFLEVFENDLFIISKSGKILKSNINDLENKSKKIISIEVKVRNLINDDQLRIGISDVLIYEDKIYLVKTFFKEDCKKLSIVYAKIDEILEFRTFKEFDECASITLGAGRLQKYDFYSKKGFLLTTNDSDNDLPGNKAQDESSIFGKIVFIDYNNANHSIFSKGHRNAQGLAVKDDIILSTEHGPRGGDEINRIIFNKNYGWPIASYGFSYKNKNLIYKKSHEKYMFEEPLFVFLPSIGISELIFLPEEFDEKWANSILVSSLNDRSIYRVKFQNDNYDKVLYTEKIYIGERIRDIKFIKGKNIILLALERTGSVGVLKKFN